MVKSSTLLLAYCFAVFNVFQAASFPAIETSHYDATEALDYLSVTSEEIKEILAMDDDVEKIKLMQKYGVDTVAKLMEISQESVKEIDRLLIQSTINMEKLRKNSERLGIEQLNFTTKFNNKVNHAQINLIEARNDLLSLASKTIHICNNIEIGIKGWQDEFATVLLKDQFKQLKRLINETKKKLDSAKTKYSELISSWSGIDVDIEMFQKKLERMVDENSEEFDLWASAIRTNVYAATGAAQAGTIILDFLGCFGACTASTWIVVLATVESAIASYKAELNGVSTQIEDAITQAEQLDQSLAKTVKLMEKETNLIIVWQEAANNVEYVINDYTLEQIKKIVSFQNIFLASVVKLKKAAQNYSDFATATGDLENILDDIRYDPVSFTNSG